MESYIHEGTEVVLTGRKAEKKTTSKRKQADIVVGTMVEIKPADPDGPTWTKWVNEQDLYKVLDDE